VKNILENVVLDLINLIRVKMWVTGQKAHFKHTLTFTQDYPNTQTIFKAEHTQIFIKHIDLKEQYPSSTGSTSTRITYAYKRKTWKSVRSL